MFLTKRPLSATLRCTRRPAGCPTLDLACFRVEMQENREFTRGEVAVHNREDDLWIIYNGKVYDMTPYYKSHPGGNAMLRRAGKEHRWFSGRMLACHAGGPEAARRSTGACQCQKRKGNPLCGNQHVA
ncbi:hypothetical protein L596_019660 [Steinernema carpocapsae]|uniref:Cytochrome b5 heme-binding domain-containing protein n=1 Tax=Steinernema carpocapsae TaxID=34508 RepID=A0A4U5MR95_STECR|nr:hypothetical protein L596_019660 [Steinernema carpocapsae]